MICKPCQKQEHRGCDNLTRAGYQVPDGDTPLSANEVVALNTGTWCDCQHVTEGTNINPVLVLGRSQERV